MHWYINPPSLYPIVHQTPLLSEYEVLLPEPTRKIYNAHGAELWVGTTGDSGSRERLSEGVLPMPSPLHSVVDDQLHYHIPGAFRSVADIFTDLPFPSPVALDPFLQATALPADMAGGT